MNAMNFSNADAQFDGSELIPHGTLVKAILKVVPFNADQGLIETQSKSSDGRYLSVELTITEGRYARRKLFDRIGTYGSEKYVNMGRSSIKAILEYGRGANPTSNPAGYELADYAALDNYGEGIHVGVKVSEKAAEGEYDAKNEIACYLSPIPESGTVKDFERLIKGDTEPSEAAKRKAANMTPRAGGGAGPQAGKPAWTQPALPGTTAAAQSQPPAGHPAHAAAGIPPHAGAAQAPAAPTWLKSQAGL